MNKLNKIKKVMLWVFGIAAWLEITKFSYNLMNKTDSYLFYIGAFTIAATGITAVMLIIDELTKQQNNND